MRELTHIVAVTGGRNYRDITRVFEVLDAMDARKRIVAVLEGGQGGRDSKGQLFGADTLARAWGKKRQRINLTVNAEWDQLGGKAGPLRSEEMLHLFPPAVLVAFPGGTGTARCIEYARGLKIRVVEIDR